MRTRRSKSERVARDELAALFQPQSIVFAWGKVDELYISRSGTVASHSILKVLTLKSGAPYYGRQ